MKTEENRQLQQSLPRVTRSIDRQHAESIEAIAQELALSVDDVTQRYEAILRELAAVAQIDDYLPILVAKRIKAQFRRTDGTR